MAGRLEKRELEPGDYDVMELPRSFRGAKWDDFKDDPAVEPLKGYLVRLHDAVSDGDGVLIVGPQLSGKSHLSAYLAKLFRMYSYTVFFASAPDIQDRVTEKAVWREDEGTCLQRYRSVDVLIIDAFGTEQEAVGRYGRNRVKEIIEYRNKWARSTIINTHLAMEDIDGQYHQGYANWLLDSFVPVVLASKRESGRLLQKYR